MSTKPNFLSTLLSLCLGILSAPALAQCADTLSFAVPLNAAQSYTDTLWIVDAEGPLDSVTVNLADLIGSGGWPSDLMVTITDPQGACVVWGGWNLIPDAACLDLGTQLSIALSNGESGPWPEEWQDTPFVTDSLSATLDTTAFNSLSGTGGWEITVTNGYTVAPQSDWSYEIILHGLCGADCDQPEACNYDAAAMYPLAEACLYAVDLFGEEYDCSGECLVDDDDDGVCDGIDPCVGTLDSCGVCNGPGAIYSCGCFELPDTDCDCDGNQPDAFGECGGDCAADEDGDGICDACVAPDGYWLDVDVVAVHDTGVLAGMTTYRVSLVCPNAGDFLRQVGVFPDAPMVLNSSTGGWYNHPVNDDWRPLGIVADSVALYPELAFDSFLTIGVEDGTASQSAAGYFGWSEVAAEFLPDGGQNLDADTTGFMLMNTPADAGDLSHPGFAGDDLQVLIMQMTTDGDISGQLNLRIYPEGMLGGGTDDVVLTFNSTSYCFNLDPCVGEYDVCGVCNGPGDVFDCGCEAIPEGDCDCDGNQLDAVGECGGDCLEDLDMDGVCDTDEILGCDDPTACNFSQEATENDGSCTYAEPPFDCNGDCLNDADGDGVCDEFEVPGCDDELACNFVGTATENDGSCTYPGDPCDDGDPQTLEDVLDEACDCVDASSIDGIGAAAWVGLEVYPNPVEDVLTVVLPLDASHALSLVSLSGQTVVAHQTAVRGTLQWPLGHLPAGVYLLHVTGAERTATRRVVVTGQ